MRLNEQIRVSPLRYLIGTYSIFSSRQRLISGQCKNPVEVLKVEEKFL